MVGEYRCFRGLHIGFPIITTFVGYYVPYEYNKIDLPTMQKIWHKMFCVDLYSICSGRYFAINSSLVKVLRVIQLDMIHKDFGKDFDKMDHGILLNNIV